MKVSELNHIIENILSKEVRKTILNESKGNSKEVFHVTCEGEPIESFDTQEEAEKYINDNKNSKKELLIDKKVYESHANMIEKLDQMGQELEEKENKNMKNTNIENQEPMEGNAFGQAVLNAKEKGEKTFEFDGEQHDVKESWKQLEEEEMIGMDENEEVSEEEECKECGQSMKEGSHEDEDVEESVDFEKMLRGKKTKVDEKKSVCEKCKKEMCECGSGMYESKKKTIRLSETELTNLIAKMVNESIPGLNAAKKSHSDSGKDTSSHLKDVDKKMKDYLSFEGNDNPEFPKPIGKGEKMARKNTEKQDDETNKNFAGLQNLDYDIEPDENFKKRLKMAIEGDRLMGNAPTTEKTNVIPSNGSKLGEEPKDKNGNSIPTPETAKKIEKQVKDRGEDKKNRVLYNKEKVPVKESESTLNNVLTEEINKMKKILNYNKKTQ